MKTGKLIWISIKLVLVSIIIFSLAYTFLLVGIGHIWKNSAQGSIIEYKGKAIGSELIAQEFTDDQYFHARPSSIDYNGLKSGSSNLAPNNPELSNRVLNSLQKINKTNYVNKKVPADLITESGSALDPHISPEAAMFQVPRIAAATGIDKKTLKNIVNNNINNRFLGVFGEKHVNVLKLNIKIQEVLN